MDAAAKRLIVADYAQGVSAIDLANGSRTILTRADGRPVHGIDGMLRCGSNYYAIYNGAPPGWLIRFTIDGDRIAFDKLIEGAPLIDPTQLAYDGKRLLIVADSGWAAVDKQDVPRASGTPIVAVPLSSDCQPL